MAVSKNKLLEETAKRMTQLYEYSFYHGVYEDDNQDNGNTNQQSGGSDMNGGNGMQDPMGGGNGMQDPMGGGDGMQDPMGGGDGMQDPMGGDGMQDPMGGDGMQDPIGGDTMQPGDEVIDVSEITDAQNALQQSQEEMRQTQEEIGGKIGDINDKLSSLMNIIDKFTKAIDINDQKIADLKHELIKRTPTEEETMNVRLNAGGNPFEQKPQEFWNKFNDINNHYNITSNNDAPQYQIRKGDIDNINDKMVSDELDDIPHSLHEYFVR